MTDGTIIFVVITLVTVTDIALALFMRARADRMDNGGVADAAADGNAAGLRKTATQLLVSAPILWLVVTLLSIGIIPSGLDPVQI